MAKILRIFLILGGFALLLAFVFWQYQEVNFFNSNGRSGDLPSPSPVEESTDTPASEYENQSDVESWNTLEDEVYGFRMSYPEGWHTSLATSYHGETQITSFGPDELSDTGGVPADHLKVAVIRRFPNTTLPYTEPAEADILDEQSITVAGQSATRQVVRPEGGFSDSVVVTFQYEGSTFILTAIPADSTHIAVFDDMLNTFELRPAVFIETPDPRERVGSPLEVSGTMPGNWMFEGQASATLRSADGTELGTGILTSSESWMTESAIPFSGEMTFEEQSADAFYELVIEKANPSGLPENARSISLPLRAQE